MTISERKKQHREIDFEKKKMKEVDKRSDTRDEDIDDAKLLR